MDFNYPDGYLLRKLPQRSRSSSKLSLSDDRLKVLATDGSGFKSAIGDQVSTVINKEFTPGYKYYFELKIVKGSLIKIGVCTDKGVFQDVNWSQLKQAFSDNEDGWAIYNGELRHNSNSTGKKYGKQYKTGDIVGVLLNMIDVFESVIKGQLSFTINGENQGIAFDDQVLKDTPLFAAIAPIYKDDGVELNMALRED